MAVPSRRAPARAGSAPCACRPPPPPPRPALAALVVLLGLGTAGAALLLPRGALSTQANARVVRGPATLAGSSAGSFSTKTGMAAVMEPPTRRDYDEFQRLIGLRLSYNSEAGGPMKFGEDRRQEATKDTTVTCRERSVDPGLSCAECVRVFTGAAYRDKAISVPAHPPQPSVTGCLALSVGASSGIRAKGYPVPLRETAFCNTVNVRF